MRKILAIILRDIKSGTRDWMIIYLSLASILIALILRALIPSVSDSTLNVVLLEDSPSAFTRYISEKANVSTVSDLEALEERVLRTDDVLGVVAQGENFEIIKQGNEVIPMEEPLRIILNAYGKTDIQLPVEIKFSDIGWRMSPIKLEGGILLIIFTTVFGGMLILLNLVEEKMSNTLSAINVTPLYRSQFIVGKGLLGFFIPIFGSLCAALILGFGGINVPMFLVSVVAIALISIIIGFSIGVMNDEPISAIASMKLVFFPIMASVFGAIFLPVKWLPILYWSPYYWAYDSIHAILLQEATWSQILFNAGMILVLTSLVFAALYKRIQRGLN